MENLRFGKHNRHRLLLYDSIQDLPIDRFMMYNRNVMIDSGIGSDMNAFEKRINLIEALMMTDKTKARYELNNLRQCVRFIMSRTSPKMFSFVSMIHTIDDQELDDLSMTESGQMEIIKQLGKKKLRVRQVLDFIARAKKKLISNLITFSRKKATGPQIKKHSQS